MIRTQGGKLPRIYERNCRSAKLKGGVRWSRCWTYMVAKVSVMNRQNFFQNFSIFPSAGGLAGKVLLAFSYTQSTHLQTTLRQFHTPVRRLIIHPFCTDFRSISTLEASEPKESGTVPQFSKMTPSRIQFWVCIPICCHNSIDGVIFEISRTVPDSWRLGASNVKMDLKSVHPYC